MRLTAVSKSILLNGKRFRPRIQDAGSTLFSKGSNLHKNGLNSFRECLVFKHLQALFLSFRARSTVFLVTLHEANYYGRYDTAG